MTKKLLFSTSFFILLFSGSVAAQMNIGYMSTQEVLRQLPQTEQIQQELNQHIQEKRTEFREQTAAFRDAAAEYEANRTSMSPGEAQQMEQELTQMRAELSEFNETIRLEIQERRNELLMPILEQIDAAIAAIAESENLDFVLNESTNNGANIIFYASQNQMDITQSVLERVR